MRNSEELNRAIAGRPITPEELLEMSRTDLTYEDVKAHFAERARINALAEQIIGEPVDRWPTFEVTWTTDPTLHYWTFDGEDPESVNLGELKPRTDVPLASIDAALTRWWQRRADEVWTVGDPRKAARIIVRWSEGLPMTPAMLAPTADFKNLVIAGGNHRLAVARAKGATVVPILMKSEQEGEVLRLLGLD
jgi:hypothetical protein